MRFELPENLLRVDEPTGSDVSVRLAQRLVKCRTVGLVQPVAGVQRQELYFRSVRQVRRFIHDKPALPHARLDGHTEERNTRRPPQQTLHPTRRDASRSWQLGAGAVGALVILAEAWRDKDERMPLGALGV